MRLLFVSNREFGIEQNIAKLWDALADQERTFMVNDPFHGLSEYTKAEHDGFDILITDDYLLPVEDKDHLKIVDVGHGIDGFKICGAGLGTGEGGYDEGTFRQIDWIIASSEETGRIRLAESLGYASIASLGIPRTDDMVNADGGHDYYLYVPSWRNESNGEGKMPIIDWRMIDDQLDESESLIIKRHPQTEEKLLVGEYRHIVEVDRFANVTDLLYNAAVVLTDYSSIIIDAYLMGKPVVLYAPDMEPYLEERGMYFPYPDDYADYIATDEHGIVDELREANGNGIGPVGLMLKDRLASACDGNATERVADFIRSL